MPASSATEYAFAFRNMAKNAAQIASAWNVSFNGRELSASTSGRQPPIIPAAKQKRASAGLVKFAARRLVAPNPLIMIAAEKWVFADAIL